MDYTKFADGIASGCIHEPVRTAVFGAICGKENPRIRGQNPSFVEQHRFLSVSVKCQPLPTLALCWSLDEMLDGLAVPS